MWRSAAPEGIPEKISPTASKTILSFIAFLIEHWLPRFAASIASSAAPLSEATTAFSALRNVNQFHKLKRRSPS